MKKPFFSLLLTVLLLMAVPGARAEDLMGLPDTAAPATRPPVAQEGEVAMMYWMLARQNPKFDAMAKKSDEYQKADQFDKDNVLRTKVSEMKSLYDMVNFSHPTVVAMLVHLAPYSEKNKGFVITDFEDQTFFKYSYAGEKYAIVPRGLMDHQFLGPITDLALVNKIKLSSYKNAKAFHLLVYLKPDFADPPNTLTEIPDEKNKPERFHIISGAVQQVALYDVGDTQQFWNDKSDEFNKEQTDELLNLKQ
jgi:hypothetical protein